MFDLLALVGFVFGIFCTTGIILVTVDIAPKPRRILSLACGVSIIVVAMSTFFLPELANRVSVFLPLVMLAIAFAVFEAEFNLL